MGIKFINPNELTVGDEYTPTDMAGKWPTTNDVWFTVATIDHVTTPRGAHVIDVAHTDGTTSRMAVNVPAGWSMPHIAIRTSHGGF